MVVGDMILVQVGVRVGKDCQMDRELGGGLDCLVVLEGLGRALRKEVKTTKWLW
jgi:hypothetical protein